MTTHRKMHTYLYQYFHASKADFIWKTFCKYYRGPCNTNEQRTVHAIYGNAVGEVYRSPGRFYNTELKDFIDFNDTMYMMDEAIRSIP